ncbi:MAG: bifunctional metallophosphatase/5'-nucleotidase [Muribaculaceae bacterium]|nr:bifunctional metallophosphatase/5'-nucleotidase [Muribaculaceae bacterium]
MKYQLLIAALIAGSAMQLTSCSRSTHDSEDNKLVILHTNDTHSQILPDLNDKGGVLRRMAVIDSIRQANQNVLLIDAGDAVQGTLFFYLYGGHTEQELLNAMDVDIRVLGNHEFDNGIDSLAAVWSKSKSEKLASNYDLSATPLKSQFKSYTIRQVGDKRVGFIGINLDPEGMIAKGNYDGLEFKPIIETANDLAERLRRDEKADIVVAVSHIGYAPGGLVGDSILALNSRGIDIIIGGHSHDTIDPTTAEGERRSHLRNLDNRPVLVVQTGKAGRKLGKIEIDLDKLGADTYPAYELINIDSRYDSYTNPAITDIIDRYSPGVDSLMHDWITTTTHAIDNKDPEILNFFSDYILARGKELAPDVDFAITNVGGIRTALPAGRVSKGHIINMLPFRNYITVIDVPGEYLEDALDVMASRGGDGVSGNVKATFKWDGKGDGEVESFIINGKEFDDDRTYRIATIDYLANGGDYMTGLTHGTVVARSTVPLYDDLIEYLTTGPGANKPISASPESRWTRVK